LGTCRPGATGTAGQVSKLPAGAAGVPGRLARRPITARAAAAAAELSRAMSTMRASVLTIPLMGAIVDAA